jgi:aspartyl-tRNA(Asn)/glutamyl-tRNA(Gln) amidotransferase subunit B
MEFVPKIGLEIHVELKTKSKMFCSCKNDPDEIRPNFNVCPICLGHPGVLPVINKEAVKKVIKTGLALNCEISEYSFFERKSYFYPDLPKGYQISQYSSPLCKNGFLEVDGKKIRIKRIHLEEDTGRLIHEKDCSLVDFNRAGISLMELVTEPDITSAKEARDFAEELQLILRYLEISDANMEKGQMRIEANISLISTNMDNSQIHANLSRNMHECNIRENSRLLGTKVEIKNLNSFRAVERAIIYEIKRQKEILKSGGRVIQETRGWDPVKEITFSQREKETEKDYRYFPEPDLPPLRITKEILEEIKREMPELPKEKRERLKNEYNLKEDKIEILTKDIPLCDYFENSVSELKRWIRDELKKVDPETEFLAIETLANYLISDVKGILKRENLESKNLSSHITPENFAEFVTLVFTKKISTRAAKDVLEEMFVKKADPSQIIEERGLYQKFDREELKKIVEEVIKENQKAVDDFKKGKEQSFQFLIGQVMRKTQGKCEPKIVKDLIREVLTKKE